jgi:mono/diheme cytochrome c family protein
MVSTKWVATCAAVVAAVAVVSLPNPARAKDSPLDRGTYLMNSIVACGNCHTPKGPDGLAISDQELAGGTVIDLPIFRSVTPNITPDPETGIGKWTDAQIINAIRNGKRPDGTTIGPPMPVEFYRNMSDTDLRAIVAYLRSVKPVTHKVEKSVFKIPLPDSYGPTITHVPDVSRQNRTAYGRYLANIGHCLECHTPMEKGKLVMTRMGAGGRELPAFPSGTVITANLTPANPDGIAKWTNAQVEETITTGVRPDGRQLVRLMAFDWYKNIEKSDLDALVAYLRTLKPAKP